VAGRRGSGTAVSSGLFLRYAIFVILLPVYYFPRAVWRTKLDPIVKVSIIAAAWGGLILVSTITSAHQASVANANGCITIAGAPKDYNDPSGGNNNCPMGYELGPTSLTCASSPEPPTQYADPTGSDLSGNPVCPAGYEPAPKPGPGYTAPYNPPLPSLPTQQAACQRHQGAETGPDFPPPSLDGHNYIVSCLDGTSTDVPAGPGG
jgi:hypothetical protein